MEPEEQGAGDAADEDREARRITLAEVTEGVELEALREHELVIEPGFQFSA